MGTSAPEVFESLGGNDKYPLFYGNFQHNSINFHKELTQGILDLVIPWQKGKQSKESSKFQNQIHL